MVSTSWPRAISSMGRSSSRTCWARAAGRCRWTGLGGHGLAELAPRHLEHAPLVFADVVGRGRTQVPFERVEIARAATYCAETADVTLRLWRLLQARLVAQRIGTVYA